MNCRKIYFIVLVILIFLQMAMSQAVESQSVNMKKTGQSSMAFLQVSVIPEATALGDAYTAVGEGIISLFYNPAGLAEMESEYEAFVSTVNWIADIRYFAGGIGWNLQSYGAVGLSILAVDYGDIIETTLISSDQAGIDQLGYRETGRMVDNLGAYAVGLGYARNITTNFKVGASFRYALHQLGQSQLTSGLKDNNMGRIVMDMGVKYYTPLKSLRMGMSMRNFAKSVKYEEITTYLPLTFSFGLAMDLMDVIQPGLSENNTLLASVEMSHPNNYTERVHMGLDYTYRSILSLQVGYVTNHDVSGLSLGFGISADLLGVAAEINYSYSKMDLFDDVNRFAVLFAF
jgi:hypothetical protein